MGLYFQGLTHDLSKYSPTEFLVGVRYYQGTRSPNNAEREAIGYSSSWLHHQGRNKHHYEYWIDYNPRGREPGEPTLAPVPMPDRYIAEMIMDRIAAAKVYLGDAYTDRSPLEYLGDRADRIPAHPETLAKLKHYLELLAEEGEDVAFRRIKEELVKGKKTK